MPEPNQDPVTVVISRRIKTGRQADFETWIAGITEAVKEFPGYLGVNVLRPGSLAKLEFVIILRFDSDRNLARWEESEVRQSWLQRVEELADSPMNLQKFSGLEYWFTPPEATTPATPPRYKMAILLSTTIFVLNLAIATPLAAWLGFLPPLARMLLIVILQVTLITYFILPFLTRSLSGWLFAPLRPRSKTKNSH